MKTFSDLVHQCPERAMLAIHEGAHAVLAHDLGAVITRISLTPMEGDAVISIDTAGLTDSDRIFVAAGGTAAENRGREIYSILRERFTWQQLENSASGDKVFIEERVESLAAMVGWDSARRLKTSAIERAAEAVQKRWATIEKLAMEAFLHAPLLKAEIEAVLGVSRRLPAGSGGVQYAAVGCRLPLEIQTRNREAAMATMSPSVRAEFERRRGGGAPAKRLAMDSYAVAMTELVKLDMAMMH